MVELELDFGTMPGMQSFGFRFLGKDYPVTSSRHAKYRDAALDIHSICRRSYAQKFIIQGRCELCFSDPFGVGRFYLEANLGSSIETVSSRRYPTICVCSVWGQGCYCTVCKSIKRCSSLRYYLSPENLLKVVTQEVIVKSHKDVTKMPKESGFD